MPRVTGVTGASRGIVRNAIRPMTRSHGRRFRPSKWTIYGLAAPQLAAFGREVVPCTIRTKRRRSCGNIRLGGTVFQHVSDTSRRIQGQSTVATGSASIDIDVGVIASGRIESTCFARPVLRNSAPTFVFRPGLPEDVAGPAALLASHRANHIAAWAIDHNVRWLIGEFVSSAVRSSAYCVEPIS